MKRIKNSLRLLLFAMLMASVFFISNPSRASAHQLIPPQAVQYIKDHPDATVQQIQTYVNQQSPGFTKKFKDKQDAIDTINARGSSYAFHGSRISKYLKNKLQSPNIGIGFIIIAMLLAMVLGALHALTPGHGKTMIAAYLIGSKGRPIDAVILGSIVTITHTSSVILLGLVALFASQYILPQTLFPYLTLISGTLILALGVTLLYKRIRNINAPKMEHQHGEHGHTHEHGHSHEQENGHSHEHGHSHNHDHVKKADAMAVSGSQPSKIKSKIPLLDRVKNLRQGSSVSMSSLVSLGISGGIVPCPDAFVVLLIAIAINKILFGLAIVVAFSFGLAAVLIVMGLLLILARPFMEQRLKNRGGWVMKILPIGSAVAVSVIGVVFTFKALVLIGLLKFA